MVLAPAGLCRPLQAQGLAVHARMTVIGMQVFFDLF